MKLIDFIIKNDSNYRSDNDEINVTSTLNLVKKYKNEQRKENLEKIIKSIDKQNSTHLSVSGNKKGDNKGIESTVSYLYDEIGVEKLNKQIKDGDNSLVDKIVINSINNRYIISFASKFCTYMSRYMFNDDKFSIYDGIMASILPYYYYRYSNDKEKIIITNKKIQNNGYQWYSSIIDSVIKGTKNTENYEISRKDLDHLLWYYYKGDKDIKDDNKNICYKSRITRALEAINKKTNNKQYSIGEIIMKVLTIKQPWATLIMQQDKRFEFRSWQTKYRGELLIHTGKGIDKEAMKRLAKYIPGNMPTGKILGKVKLVDCVKMSPEFKNMLLKENKDIYTDSSFKENYGWQLEDVEVFKEPIEAKGKLSLWEYEL